MRALNHKLVRDLWTLRGQVFTIALVLASGIASFIMSISTLESLQVTRAAVYSEFAFAEVFANVTRAPAPVADEIAAIPGVATVETRVSGATRIELPGFADPVMGQLVSIPDEGQPQLNRLFLRQGRLPQEPDEMVISDGFAEVHALQLGDSLQAVINGRQETLQITGIGLAPDYIYQMGASAGFPDIERFAVLWMQRSALATALDMEGAWNEISMTLAPGVREEDVIERIDLALDRYGGLGAYGRDDQISNRFLNEEFRQLQNIAGMVPVIFLGVAAFLLNVVISRLIGTERDQVATLKAFGYSNLQVGYLYAKFVAVIVLLGTAGGVAIGVILGQLLSGLYRDFYRFPYLNYFLSLQTVAWATGITTFAAALGTFRAVRRGVTLPPAQAMRPEAPPTYRPSFLERIGLQRFLTQPSRMILRDLQRRPVKSLFSILGISAACAVVIFGSFFADAVRRAVDIEFRFARSDDMTVMFSRPLSRRALYEIETIPGVEHAEPFRMVPVTLYHGAATYRTQLEGYTGETKLRRLIDQDLNFVNIPAEGILLNSYAADLLGLETGDTVRVEVMQGRQLERDVPVVGIIEQYMGSSGYMRLDRLNHLVDDAQSISGVSLAVAPGAADAINNRLEEMAWVSGVQDLEAAIANFNETFAEQILIFISISSLFAAAIAFGVIYNSARISLAERSRELASLRVLGYTRGEISYILLGQLALITLLAIPIGFLFGRILGAVMIANSDTEFFRIPLYVDDATLARAALTVLGAAAFSALVVRRKLDQLDLIGVLKTRE
jgi:putative ABC transport system permease protein